MTEIKPNLRTPFEDLSANEKAKMATNGLRTVVRDIQSPTNLSYQMRNLASDDVHEIAEILEKSYGIYLEFNRALTGKEPDWMYMLRITVPGGGPWTRRQWQIIESKKKKREAEDLDSLYNEISKSWCLAAEFS